MQYQVSRLLTEAEKTERLMPPGVVYLFLRHFPTLDAAKAFIAMQDRPASDYIIRLDGRRILEEP